MKRAWIVVGLVLALAVTPVALAQDSIEIDASVVARAAAELADAYLGGLHDMMGILATTADLQVGVWGGMQELLGRFETLPAPFDAWYLLPDGSYYKVETGLASANLSDRNYFPKVMAGEATYGDLVVSKSTGRKSMVMTVPIERSGSVIGALGVTVYLDEFSALILDALEIPEGMGLFAHTPEGRITMHADVDLLLEGADASGIEQDVPVGVASDFLGWIFVVGPTAE